MLRYDKSPSPGRETHHSAQLQTQQRGDETRLIMTDRHQGHSALPYRPAPSYFIHKNRGLWQFWTAVFFLFLFFFFLHWPLTASRPRCSCTGCTADTYATVQRSKCRNQKLCGKKYVTLGQNIEIKTSQKLKLWQNDLQMEQSHALSFWYQNLCACKRSVTVNFLFQ